VANRDPRPDAAQTMLEDYRAGLGFDRVHEEAGA
jgi:hypothetical protein